MRITFLQEGVREGVRAPEHPWAGGEGRVVLPGQNEGCRQAPRRERSALCVTVDFSHNSNWLILLLHPIKFDIMISIYSVHIIDIYFFCQNCIIHNHIKEVTFS